MLRDIILGLFIAAVLILVFNTSLFIENKYPPPANSGVPTYLGDSGMVVSGSGAEPSNMSMVEFQINMEHKPEKAEDDSESSTIIEEIDREDTEKTNKDEIPEAIREEQYNMNEILLAFWHGVAAVLIGETAILMITTAGLKLHKKISTNTKED